MLCYPWEQTMPRMSKICLFPSGLSGGGRERVFVNLAAGFVASGLAVDMVVARKEGRLLAQIHPQVNVVSCNARRMLTILPALCQYLRTAEPDVALTGGSPTHTMMSLARLVTRARTRLFASVHSTKPYSDDKPTAKRVLQERMELASYATADKIIVVSRGVYDDMIQNKGVPPKKLEVIYNPVLTEDFNDLASENVTHPFFAAGQPPVILGVGRLTTAKDFGTLIKAFALAIKKLPMKLIILGEGEERRALEELIAQQQRVGDISLPGFVENPYPYMRGARLFVSSSSWEGFSNVLVEALACGCQIVSTDCQSGPAEVLANGKYGTLVPVGDPAMMANAIVEALQEHRTGNVDPAWLRQFRLQPVARRYLEVFGLQDHTCAQQP